MTYEQSVEQAKNIGIEKGIYSKEYADAVKQMNDLWLKKRKTRLERLTNAILKKIWQKQQNSY